MRPFIPTEVLVRETPELQKSVAADLNVPDPAPANIVTPEPPKSTKKSSKSLDGSVANRESAPEYDAGSGSVNNNASVQPASK